jgi:hypothetical protein
MTCSWKALVVVAVAATLCSGPALAGIKFNVRGVNVSLSCPGDASYDEGDGTVTIEPGFDWCAIKVAMTPLGTAVNGAACDVFILATGKAVDSISVKGSWETWFYVTGQTYHCTSLKVSQTNIGWTLTYGPDVGLGMTSATDPDDEPYPSAISLKYGVCFAGCLANDYFTKKARTLDEVLPAAGRKILLGR